MNFRFFNVVWGEFYTDLFLKLTLPCELSPGNLGEFRYKDDSSYAIYTTSKDAEVIASSQVYAKLSQIMSTEIILMDDIELDQNKYTIVAECHRREIVRPFSEDRAFVILNPDEVCSDGTFARMAEIADSGKRAVISYAPRLNLETLVPEVLDRFYSAGDLSTSIPPRELVKLGIDHMDQQFRALHWDTSRFNTAPSLLQWNVPGEGLLARAFHLHPLMVRPRRQVKSFNRTIDIDYVFRACPDTDDIYIVQDSDEFVYFTVGQVNPAHVYSPNTASELGVARWAAKGTVKGNRWFLRHKIRIHFTDISPLWDQVERASDKVVDRILFLTKFKVLFLVVEWRWTKARIWDAILRSRLGSAAVRLLRLKQLKFRFIGRPGPG